MFALTEVLPVESLPLTKKEPTALKMHIVTTPARKSSDDYVLARNTAAAIRLQSQHFVWKKFFGYNLHPVIPRNDPLMRIADVGTGTAVWPLDLADELPETVQFHGFDIDISQTPHPSLLPDNVKVDKLDAFQPVPLELQSQFDIVNLRLFVLVVRNNDPTPVLKNLISMLKPGGYLQWSEADHSNVSYQLLDSGATNTALKTLHKALAPKDPRLAPGNWCPVLGDYFTEQGLVDVQCHRISEEDVPRKWQASMQDTMLAVYTELIGKMPPGEVRDRFWSLLDEAEAECRRGATWYAPRLMWVARKPL